jgi:hypothetical protein
VPNESVPSLSLFLDIVKKLESLNIPYVIIGGFAATIYGISRSTHDIDIIVDLDATHIQALAEAYSSPRYYADPYQMSNAVRIGSSFNIIDADEGEKADLFPITVDPRYRPALENRVRQTIRPRGMAPLEVWVARPEDVIIGKLMAWTELQTSRHQSDIYEMMVYHYLGAQHSLTTPFDEKYVDAQASRLGKETFALWQQTKMSAKQEALNHQS